ncbi:MAG: phosphopantetheine-binding protein, partial [Polyangiaceae bacterium]
VSPDTPRTPTEAMVLEIFRDVLQRSDAGVHDNFFDLGGDSLMAARLVLDLRAACGNDVPLRLLFERQTPADLAAAVETIAVTASPAGGTVGARERVEIEL